MILVSDNASSEYKLVEHLQTLLPNFHPDEHHFGCVNHVFNLAVKDGLKSIGLKDESDAMYPHFKHASVINKIRQFAKYVRSSQRRQKFLNLAPLGNEHQKLMVILRCVYYMEFRPRYVGASTGGEAIDRGVHCN